MLPRATLREKGSEATGPGTPPAMGWRAAETKCPGRCYHHPQIRPPIRAGCRIEAGIAWPLLLLLLSADQVTGAWVVAWGLKWPCVLVLAEQTACQAPAVEQRLGRLGHSLLLLGLWADQIAHRAPGVDPTRSLMSFSFPRESSPVFLFSMPFGGSV